MNTSFLKNLAFQNMIKDIALMNAEQITAQLFAMGCPCSYDDIKDRLQKTCIDIEVADALYEEYEIKQVTYPIEFIDEAVYEVCKRENYGFLHYGIVCEEIRDIINSDIIEKSEKLTMLEQAFRKLCQSAQTFHIQSFESFQYKANDGNDLYAWLMETLDTMQQVARTDKQVYQQLLRFTEKLLTTFAKSNCYFLAGIQYEQASAYIAHHSSKGDQIFEQLLKTHDDPCDVVFHYALAYIDDNEKKTRRILQRYQKYCDTDSDTYPMIEQLKNDLDEEGGVL